MPLRGMLDFVWWTWTWRNPRCSPASQQTSRWLTAKTCWSPSCGSTTRSTGRRPTCWSFLATPSPPATESLTPFWSFRRWCSPFKLFFLSVTSFGNDRTTLSITLTSTSSSMSTIVTSRDQCIKLFLLLRLVYITTKTQCFHVRLGHLVSEEFYHVHMTG